MKTFQLFTDSHCDMTKEEAKSFGYEIISMPFSINGKLYFPYKDKISSHFFYERMRQGDIVKTHSLSPQEYIDIFEPVLKQGLDIVYVSLSTKMTGTHKNIDIAWETYLKIKYPQREFYLIDTKNITAGMRIVVEYVAGLASASTHAEDFVEEGRNFVNNVYMYFFPEDLNHFRRGGRVSGLSAFAGNLLGIRPLMTVNKNGELKIVKKVRGKKKIIKELIETIIKEFNLPEVVYIAVSDNNSLKLDITNALKEKIPNITIKTFNINPTTGAHCGPDTIGIALAAKDRN